MFRKIFSVIYIFIIISLMTALVLTLFSCGEKAKEDDKAANAADTSGTSGEKPTEADTDEPTTPEPVPRKINKWVTFAETDVPGDQNPVRVGDGGGFPSIGAKFTAEFIMTDMWISCPSWSDNVGSMVFKIYKWDTDYDTTVAGTPVLVDTETFVDYDDNATVELVFDPEIEPGTYLWELSEGKGGVGLWAFKTHGQEGLEFYKNKVLFTDGTAFNAEINGYIMSE